VDKQDKSGGEGNGLKRRRLKELAVEASRHLDEILPSGDRSGVLKKSVRGGHALAGDDSSIDSRPGAPGRRRPKRGKTRSLVVHGKTAAPTTGVSSEAPGVVFKTSLEARVAGRRHLGPPGSRAGRPSALVVHVSHGVAKVLANLLNNMGVDATVATNVEEVRSGREGGPWDLLFVQGTSMPYPGKELATLALDGCLPHPPCVVLLTRPGDTLLAEAGTWSATALLQWPFSPEEIGKILATVMPKMKTSSPQ
jgi:hypothetical protein